MKMDTGPRSRPAPGALVGALGVFVIVNLVVGLVATGAPVFFPGWPSREMAVKAQQMRDLGASRGSVDVAFVGDSVVAVGIDPAIVMKSGSVGLAYNAATLGSVPEIWASWVPDVVVPLLHPRLVVIFVGPRNLVTRDNINGGRDFMASEAMRELTHADPPLWAAVKAFVPLFRYRDALSNSQMLLGALTGYSSCVSEGRCLSEEGFSSRPFDERLRIPPGWEAEHTSPDMMDLSGKRVRILIDLINELKQEGIDVVVVELPELPEMRDINLTDPAVQYPAFQEALTLVRDEAGVDVWDANELTWSRSDFADPLHLNGRGVEKASEWLGGRIAVELGTSVADSGH